MKSPIATVASWSDLALERATGLILRIGVISAAGLVAAGGVVYLLRAGSLTPDYGSFSGALAVLTSPAAVIRGVLNGHPTALIEAGLLVLVLTPVTRVAFALLAFALRRDVLFVLFSLIVLTVLTLGLTGHSL